MTTMMVPHVVVGQAWNGNNKVLANLSVHKYQEQKGLNCLQPLELVGLREETERQESSIESE